MNMTDQIERVSNLGVDEKTLVRTPDTNYMVRRTEDGLEKRSAMSDWQETSIGEIRDGLPN